MPKNVVPSIGFFFKQNVFHGTTWDAVLTPRCGSNLSILELAVRRCPALSGAGRSDVNRVGQTLRTHAHVSRMTEYAEANFLKLQP